jgi:hypothetical protein
VSCCAVALFLATACGRDEDEGVPSACRQGEQAVRAALRAAPEKVRIDGTPLSACLVDGSDEGELRAVGTALLESAADLTVAAAERPEGPAAVQLGYLIGAVRRAASATEGTNSELVRRLDQEVVALGPPSEAFERGRRAGLEGG